MPTKLFYSIFTLLLTCIVLNVLAFFAMDQQPDNGLVARFVLYFLVYAYLLAAFLFYKNTKEKQMDALEPIYVVLGLYTLYTWTPAIAVILGMEDERYLWILDTYCLAIVLGLVGLLTGYLLTGLGRLRFLGRIASVRIKLPLRNYRKLLIMTAILLLVLNLKSIVETFNIGAIKGYTETASAWRAERTESWGFFAYFHTLSMTFLISALLLNSFINKKLAKLPVFLFGSYALITVMGGSRGIIISFVLVLALYYHYYVHKLRFSVMLLLGGICFTTFLMLGHARSTTNLLELLPIAINLIQKDPKILLPLSSGEFLMPSRSLFDIAAAIEAGEQSFSYGVTYLNDLMTLIPRVLFPSRPLPQPEMYMQTFYPILASEGKGFAFFLTTEGFWAFGHIGSFLAMLLYGIFIALLYKIFIKNLDNGAIALLYALSYYSLFVSFMRTGFVGALKMNIMYILPFVIVMMLSFKIPLPFKAEKQS
jgi:oligosaccharide repeat unit polymerase